MKRNWLLITVLVSAALNIAFIGGYFHSDRRAAQAARPDASAVMAVRLGLNADQEATFGRIHAVARRALADHLADDAPTIDAYWTALLRGDGKDGAVDSLIAETANRRVDLNRRLTVLLREFMSGLSPDQRRDFASLLRNRTVFGGRFMMSGVPRRTVLPQQSELTQ